MSRKILATTAFTFACFAFAPAHAHMLDRDHNPLHPSRVAAGMHKLNPFKHKHRMRCSHLNMKYVHKRMDRLEHKMAMMRRAMERRMRNMQHNMNKMHRKMVDQRRSTMVRMNTMHRTMISNRHSITQVRRMQRRLSVMHR